MNLTVMRRPRPNLAARARAAGAHLLLSLLVAALAAVLVFGLWYPGLFRSMAGGRELFMLVVGVDVVIGPLLTFAVFDLSKGWPHLRRDLIVIALVQLAALGYGLHTVYVARPVAMIFEVDRFRLLAAVDVWVQELERAPPQYRQLPLTGPWLLAARNPVSGEERNDALMMGMRGVDVGQRPLFWQAYGGEAKAAAKARARPVSLLGEHYPARSAELNAALAGLGARRVAVSFLPVAARGDWVVILDQAGDVLGYVPIDGWFEL